MEVTISELVLEELTPSQVVEGDGRHTYSPPTKHVSEEQIATYRTLTMLTRTAATTKVGTPDDIAGTEEEQKAVEKQNAPLGHHRRAFKLRINVSSVLT